MSKTLNNTVSVEIEVVSDQEIGKPLLIRGKFNVLYEQSGIAVKGVDVLKHIVLVVIRGGNHSANTPFENIITFDDDIKSTEQGCSGQFSFNLFDKITFDGAGDYYILCSIGSVTSNIIHAYFEAK